MHRATITAIAATILAIATPTAHAGTYVHTDDGRPANRYNRWLRAAHVSQPDADIIIRVDTTMPIAECGGNPMTFGCTLHAVGGDNNYIVHVAATPDQTAAETRAFFLHEVGHVFDHTMLNDRQRRRFLALDQQPHSAWTGNDYTARPSEHFAIAYAACAWQGKLPPREKYDPTPAEAPDTDMLFGLEIVSYLSDRLTYRRTCSLIDRAALGTGMIDNVG